jgi:hypothetical protein
MQSVARCFLIAMSLQQMSPGPPVSLVMLRILKVVCKLIYFNCFIDILLEVVCWKYETINLKN